MILPVYAYGQNVLKKKAQPLEAIDVEVAELIENMWETMYNAHGVGLAAPQIGKSIRLFLVDTVQILEEDDDENGIKKVFINANKIDENGEPWPYEEGCLSIPHIRADVSRPETITLEYRDENFELKRETFEGISARVIQHEYDHIEGVLFTDHLTPLKKRLLKRKLEAIKKGNVEADYRLKFPKLK